MSLTEVVAFLQIALIGDKHASLTLDGFHEETANHRVFQSFRQSVHIVVGDSDESGRERTETCVGIRIVGKGDDGDGTTVEVAFAHNDLGLVFRKTFLVITPTTAEFQSRFVSLGAGVHGENLVVAESLGDIFLERSQAVIVECAGGQGDLLSLIDHGSDDLRVAVTLVHSGISGKEVEIFLAFHVPHEGTFTASDDHAQGMIIVRAIAGFHVHCLLA